METKTEHAPGKTFSASQGEATVLCVQPVREHRSAITAGLHAFRVSFVETGLDALRAFNAGHYDAYVLDYWLADWSGLSLCRQIRKGDPYAPTLFFSSAEGEDQRKRAMRAGADAYLLASSGARVLAQELRQALTATRLRNLQARIEGERAIREELERRASIAIEASEFARTRAAEALERAVRARAHKAFMAAGGTIAGFERMWSEVYRTAHNEDRVA